MEVGGLEPGGMKSVPQDLVGGYEQRGGGGGLALILEVEGGLRGIVALPSPAALEQFEGELAVEVTCGSTGGEKVVFFAAFALLELGADGGGGFLVDITLKPRAVVVNLTGVEIEVRTPMPQTLSGREVSEDFDHPGQAVHRLGEGEKMEIFSGGRMICCSMRIASETLAGGATGWVQGDFVELVFGKDAKVGLAGGEETESFLFPFFENSGGCPFKIVESAGKGAGKDASGGNVWEVRHCNILFDHTGEVMFGRSGEALPLSMLDSGIGINGARVALLPPSESLLKMVRFEDGKAVTSNVFCLNDIAMTSSGGLTSSSLVAEDTGVMVPYAIYRTMGGVAHVVPHFRLVNETGFKVTVTEPGNGGRTGAILAIEDRTSGVVKPKAEGGYVTLELDGVGVTGPIAVGGRVGTGEEE